MTEAPQAEEADWLLGLWYFASPAARVAPGRTIAKEILGRPVLLGRAADGAPFALHDLCPHRGVRLSEGRFESGEVVCPFHGWRFGVDGRCRAVPSLTTAQSVAVEKIGVAAYPVREVQGNLWVYIPAGGEAARGGDCDDAHLRDRYRQRRLRVA